jgi:hypothetical protein
MLGGDAGIGQEPVDGVGDGDVDGYLVHSLL